jgi:hypothetical protein
MATKCNLCHAPFLPDEEGLEKELAGVPIKLCGKCWEGMQSAVEENEAHIFVSCPHCNEEIGIRVETINDP